MQTDMKTQLEYSNEIEALAKRLTAKARKFAKDDKNKYMGDLAYVMNELRNLDNFLK